MQRAPKAIGQTNRQGSLADAYRPKKREPLNCRCSLYSQQTVEPYSELNHPYGPQVGISPSSNTGAMLITWGHSFFAETTAWAVEPKHTPHALHWQAPLCIAFVFTARGSSGVLATIAQTATATICTCIGNSPIA